MHGVTLFHDYSDEESVVVPIVTYSINELFAEKLRALVERTRPRDLYDVVQIYEKVYGQDGLPQEFQKIINEKFAYKNLEYKTGIFSVVEIRKQELLESWRDMLAHQINPLAPADDYVEKFKTIQKHLF